jgi:hypothetical protein
VRFGQVYFQAGGAALTAMSNLLIEFSPVLSSQPEFIGRPRSDMPAVVMYDLGDTVLCILGSTRVSPRRHISG